MKKQLSEEKKLSWTVYRVVARFVGWLILALGVIGGVVFLLEILQIGGAQWGDLESSLGTFRRSWFILIITGLVTLSVAQFIRYIDESEFSLCWILRHIRPILYLCAVIVAIKTFALSLFMIETVEISNDTSFVLYLSFVILPTIAFNLAKVLILIGLGQIMERVLIITENQKVGLKETGQEK